MAISAALPRKMISLSPAVWNALLGLVTALVLGVVAIGQYLAGRQKGWQDLAQSRAEKIDDLQRDHAAAITRGEAERADLQQQLAAASALHAQDQEALNLRLDTMEKMVAYLERQNHLLQNQLDESEARLKAAEKRSRRHQNEETKS